MSDEACSLIHYLNQNEGISTLSGVLDWLATKGWQNEAAVAILIYPDDEELQDSFDLKDLKGEFHSLMIRWGGASLETVLRNA